MAQSPSRNSLFSIIHHLPILPIPFSARKRMGRNKVRCRSVPVNSVPRRFVPVKPVSGQFNPVRSQVGTPVQRSIRSLQTRFRSIQPRQIPGRYTRSKINPFPSNPFPVNPGRTLADRTLTGRTLLRTEHLRSENFYGQGHLRTGAGR